MMCTRSEIERILVDCFGTTILNEIPSAGISDHAYFAEIVDALCRRNLVNRKFFSYLSEVRPGHVETIENLALRWDVTFPPPEKSPDDSRIVVPQVTPRPIEYFCYISRNKVDQLNAQVATADYSSLSSTPVSFEDNAYWEQADVDMLFHNGRSFGRIGRIQRGAEKKRSYMEKLELVIRALSQQHPIYSAADAVKEHTPPTGVLYHTADFRVSTPLKDPRVDTVVTIVADVFDRLLLLDCSLRNFSEGPLPDGEFVLNSANARFFHADLSLRMTTVFFVLEWSPHRIVGTPLFLKLALSPDDHFTAL